MKYELDSCDTTYNYTSEVTLSGTAKFFKRGVNLVIESNKLLNMTLGDPLAEALPIRFAELAVYDASNRVVQCGRTDELGVIKAVDGTSDLRIPALSGTFTVRIFSRITKTLSQTGKPDFNINVSLKRDKYTNELYYLTGSTYANGIDDVSVALLAYARQNESLEVIGGAFNILNSIYTAYDYIRTNTSSINTTCLNEKLNVYWKAGFNPGQYYYPEKDPSDLTSTSFYDKDTYSLYITGGKLGNINLEPTHHFDDYVIIHELGHHIENVCGSLLSPGGSHYIIARVDPRLAWAEGWANYFAGQVMFDRINTINPEFQPKMTSSGFANTNWTYLFASEGFSDSVQNIGNGSGFMFDLKKEGKNPDTWQTGSLFGQPFDKVDPLKYFGEGHFREGAITRGLFKLSNNCGVSGTCIDSAGKAPISFNLMWSSMNKITGMGVSDYVFKSSATFLELLKSRVSSATWSADYKTFNEAAAGESLHLFSDLKYSVPGVSNSWQPYGQPLIATVPGGLCATQNHIEPRPDDPVLTSTNSDQRYSNHFYTVDFNTLTGLDEIRLSVTQNAGTAVEFDLLLFQQDYFFNGDYACTLYDSNGDCTTYAPSRSVTSDVVKSDRRSGTFSYKSIRNLSSLDRTKKYLLNIRAYTANKSISTSTNYTYRLTDQNGDAICPPAP